MANVLVVARREDEAENLRSLLVEGGHTVTVAVGGFFALTLLERNRPEIVFAWANTGDMPGEEFCSIVRGDPAMDAVQLLLLGRGLNATAPPGVLLAPGFSTPSEIVDLIHGALGLPPRLPGPEPEKPPDEKPQDELQGRLDIVRLSVLLRLLAHEHHSGCLRFVFRTGGARICFSDGRLVDARFGVVSGDLAFEEIVREADADPTATFHFVRNDPREMLDFPETIFSPLEQLLVNVSARLERRRGRWGSA